MSVFRSCRRLAPLLSLLPLLLSACASRAPAPSPATAAANPRFLLLGEIHDNAQGHRLRFEQLRQRVEAGWRPAVAMEQFDRDSQALLTKAQQGCLDAGCLIKVVGGPGWDWQLYRPVLELALQYQLPLLAVNLSRADASRVVRDGVASAFDAATVAEYGLGQPLPAELRQLQRRELADSHCQMLPEAMIEGMVDAQVARDVLMSKLMRARRDGERDVVLLAGNGHVRKDVGVARWLRQVEPGVSVLSIAYLEQSEPAGRYDETRQLAPRSRPDPCASLNNSRTGAGEKS